LRKLVVVSTIKPIGVRIPAGAERRHEKGVGLRVLMQETTAIRRRRGTVARAVFGATVGIAAAVTPALAGGGPPSGPPPTAPGSAIRICHQSEDTDVVVFETLVPPDTPVNPDRGPQVPANLPC
jgi:hypothetical protein